MSDTPRIDALLPMRLQDHTDADYMDLLNVARRIERELRASTVYVEGLKADAERYRYLRAHFTQGVRWRLEWYLPRWGEGTSAEQLDATLDAALAKNPAQDDAHRVFPKSLALIEEAQAALGAVHEIDTGTEKHS